MNKMFRIIALCLLISRMKAQNEDYCYAKDNNPFEFYSTFTSYDKVKGEGITDVKTCKPIYFWVVVKHGVKHTSDKEIGRSKQLNTVKTEIKANYDEKRTTLCTEDYQNIQSWTNVLDKNQDEKLAKKAFESHESLAATLISANYLNLPTPTKDMFQFLTSKDKDAKDAAIVFSNKMLNTNYKNVTGNEIKENEELLKSKSDCPKWSDNEKEMNDFISSPYAREMRLRVSSRIGYLKELPAETIDAMDESCVYDKITTSSAKPPFCAIFNPDDLKTFEYIQDLKHYYEYGYGNPLSEKFGCPLVGNMLTSISNAATDSNKLKGTVLFGDQETLNGVLVKLGLHNDDQPPTCSNYQTKKNNREWKSSLIDPYTANIYAVLYNCGENNEKKVELFHNQNSIKLPGCNENKCALETFKTEVNKVLKDTKCDDKYCSVETPSSANMQICSIVVLFVGLFISRL